MIDIYLFDTEIADGPKAIIFDPGDHGQCGEYRLMDHVAEWCDDHGVKVRVKHCVDESCELCFETEAARLMFCIRWDLMWALTRK